jgi:hypothetical protein
MTEIERIKKEFRDKFTYLDKQGNPRMNNVSPRKVQGFIATAIEQYVIKARIEEVNLFCEKIGDKNLTMKETILLNEMGGERIAELKKGV